jgi:hypothetical protein
LLAGLAVVLAHTMEMELVAHRPKLHRLARLAMVMLAHQIQTVLMLVRVVVVLEGLVWLLSHLIQRVLVE